MNENVITGRDAGGDVRKYKEDCVGLRERSWAISLMAQDIGTVHRIKDYELQYLRPSHQLLRRVT